MVSYPNFLYLGSIPSVALMTAKNKLKKTIYYWFNARSCSRLAILGFSLDNLW
nr:MAG TPA: hypothetical protein [Caudoviricetes sp.]